MPYVSVNLMFEVTELDEYKKDFNDLGIMDEADMLSVLNYLDTIADIGHEAYVKNIIL